MADDDDRLVLGEGARARVISDAGALLEAYRTDDGTRYLDFVPTTPPDRLAPEDLAVTILINSRVRGPAFKSVQDRGLALDLGSLPAHPLEETSSDERSKVAELVGTVARWPGFACSVATKVLHKKRPGLIPILDNQAIFGAYLNPAWPGVPSGRQSVYSNARILAAVEAIHADVVRPENQATWRSLQARRPGRTRVELFDMVWWSYFRRFEPVAG